MFPILKMSYNSNYLPNAPTFKDHHMKNENRNKHEEGAQTQSWQWSLTWFALHLVYKLSFLLLSSKIQLTELDIT